MGRFDRIIEIDKGLDVLEEIEKFNANHDRRWRFASAGNGGAIQTSHPPGKYADHGNIDRDRAAEACAELTKTSKKKAEKLARAAYTFTTGEYAKIRKFQKEPQSGRVNERGRRRYRRGITPEKGQK